MQVRTLTATAKHKGMITEGKEYVVVSRYESGGTEWIIIVSDGGSYHHIDVNGEYYAEHFGNK